MARIAMIVGNPCNPDYRVTKEAEALAGLGHEVRVFCRAKEGVPDFTTINLVTYQRLPLGRTKPKPETALALADAASIPVVQVANAPGWGPGEAPILMRLRERSRTELRRAWRMARSAVRTLWRMKPNPLPALRKRFKNFVKFEQAAQAFAPAVTAFRPDVVHAHDLFCLPAGLVAAGAAGAKLVYDSHELEIHRNPPLPPILKRYYGWIESRAIRHADAVITVCDPIADHLRDEYHIARPVVLFNAPSIEPSPASAVKPARTSIRSDARVPAHMKLGVYVGLVTINRGIETLLEALAGQPDVFIAAVGPKNAAYAPSLLALAQKLGVADRFVMLAPVPPEQVVAYISGADFGLNPLIPVTLSYQYAMPNKLFEMAFAGLPIINSDALESARFVKEHGLGVIYPSGDAAACRAAIAKVAGNPAAYRLPADALSTLRQAYGWHRQAEKLGALYRRLLAAEQAHAAVMPGSAPARA